MDLLNRFMVWTDTWTPGSPGTTEMKVLTRQGESYSQSDLTGTWEANSLVSGPDAPYWIRGTFPISSDGSFSVSLEEYQDDPHQASGALIISPEGIITMVGNDTFLCAMDSEKTIIACTDTWSGSLLGSSQIVIMTKMAESYSLEDLSGSWEMSNLATGPGAPWWLRAHLEIGTDGSFSATSVESDGTIEEFPGNLQISSSGIITLTGNPNMRGNLDSSKTIVIMTSTWDGDDSPGTTEMIVLTKISN